MDGAFFFRPPVNSFRVVLCQMRCLDIAGLARNPYLRKCARFPEVFDLGTSLMSSEALRGLSVEASLRSVVYLVV